MRRQKFFSIIFILFMFLLLFSSCSKKTTEPVVQTVATPSFDPAGDTYSSAQSITITCTTAGATIHYTTDGIDPTSSSAVYSTPINLSSSATLKAKASKSGYTDSSIASATYTINVPQTVATPSFDPPGGAYSSAQSITITCATAGATIRYTTDGNDPNSNSAVYSNPINLSSSATLKAKASKSGYTDSSIASATYTINVPQTIATPSFDPPGGTYFSAQSVSLACATSGATIRYTTNGTEPTAASPAYSTPINVASTTSIKAKGFKDGWTPSVTASATYTINLPPPPIQMIYIPGGSFTMGRTTGVGYSYELPTHSVTLSSFYLGKYQVTQAEYATVMGSNPAYDWGVRDNYPVYRVSWYSAMKYCNLRSLNEGLTPVYSISGSTNPAAWGNVPTSDNATWNAAICNWTANGYRLPTEAEWEYAARGASNTPDYLYSGSDDLNAVGWYDSNSGNTTHPVGSKAPNALGLYDMSGNIWEWCWDWYSGYSSSPSNNPTGPNSGTYRVFRGGVWNDSADYCRVAYRNGSYPCGNNPLIGFRLCRAGL